MDRGAWWATDYGIAKSQTPLSNKAEHTALRALWRYLISWLSFSLPNHMGVYSGTRVPGFKPDFTTSQLCDLNSYLTTLKMCPHL